MRILLITDEEWNDAVFGNNVLSNWFSGFDAEFAQIYCSPGLPYNAICERYFQITDTQMVRSLLGPHKSGCRVSRPETAIAVEASKRNAQRQGHYKWLKKLSVFIHTPMMLLRDAIWRYGRYDTAKLLSFVEEFNPDIVFCPRFITPKLMRLEKMVSGMTNAPFVAFTADNEASLNHYSWSPLYWLRAWMIHRSFGKHIKLYKHYFTFSEEQAQDYHRQYGLPTTTLYKCGQFSESFETKTVSSPVKMVYAGRMYCNRWQTLAAVGKALELVNEEEERIVLDIFTTEALTKKQRKVFEALKHVNVHPAITPVQLAEEYRNADIALHVESFDKHNRSATRYSFSTKIIDLMASTCAIMAICWERHAGYQYLKAHDAAFCVSSYDDIAPMLRQICERPSCIGEYARKAWQCGREYHSQEKIQAQIRETFNKVITGQDNDRKVSGCHRGR